MAKITISEAARQGFSTRPTIYRKLKSGSLTATEDSAGNKVVDVADLVALFGEPGEKPAIKKSQKDGEGALLLQERLETQKSEIERLKAELASAHQEARQDKDDASKERDRLLGIVESHQRLIEDMTKERDRGVFERLFGKKSAG